MSDHKRRWEAPRVPPPRRGMSATDVLFNCTINFYSFMMIVASLTSPATDAFIFWCLIIVNCIRTIRAVNRCV